MAIELPIQQFEKRAGALLNFGVDWEAWLDGDTIAASTWLVPDGLVVTDEEFTTTKSTIWIEEGLLGAVYELWNEISTASGTRNLHPIYITII